MKKCGLLLFTVYFEFIFSEPVPRNLSQCDSAKSIYSQTGFATDDIFSIEQSGSFFFFILFWFRTVVSCLQYLGPALAKQITKQHRKSFIHSFLIPNDLEFIFRLEKVH